MSENNGENNFNRQKNPLIQNLTHGNDETTQIVPLQSHFGVATIHETDENRKKPNKSLSHSNFNTIVLRWDENLNFSSERPSAASAQPTDSLLNQNDLLVIDEVQSIDEHQTQATPINVDGHIAII